MCEPEDGEGAPLHCVVRIIPAQVHPPCNLVLQHQESSALKALICSIFSRLQLICFSPALIRTNIHS